MASLVRCAALVSLLAAEATAQFPRAVSGKGYLAVPIGTHEKTQEEKDKVKRDDDFLETVLGNMEFWYSTEIGFGNPPQNITVLVDTGSSKLWINPECDNARTVDQYRDCLSFGEYEPDDSDSAVGPFGRELLMYGDPSDEATLTEARLVYYADDLWFGDVKLENQTFGTATRSQGISQGIFGLGPDLETGFEGTDPHSLVLHSMAEQGLIASRVFAVDLRHSESDTGAVIYGGIDRNKFIGSLEKLPVIPAIGGVVRLSVTLNHIGITLGDEDPEEWDLEDDETNVLLDSGTTLSRLHRSVVRPILQALDAIDTGEGYFLVDCEMREAPGSVDFGFGDKIVRVPFSDFIIDLGNPMFCYVGVALTTEQQILGDTVMRAGYFVFDWDNEEVHVAQAANCGDSDIVAVSSGSDAVPSVTGNCASSDAEFTGGSAGAITRTRNSDPITTTFLVSSCASDDSDCETGVPTTQVVDPATVTVTVPGGGGSGGDGGEVDEDDDDSGDGSGSSGDDDDEDAGVRPEALSMLLLAAGLVGVGWNLL